MLKKILPILVLILLIDSIYGQANNMANSTHKAFYVEEKGDYILKYFFIFYVVIVVTIVRHLIRGYEIPIPYGVFDIILGICWGIGMLHSSWMERLGRISFLAIINLINIYLPVTIFTTAFCIDVHCFYKSLTQILVISFPASVLSSTMCGLMVRMLIDPRKWSEIEGMYLGIISSAIFPMDILRFLQDNTLQNKHLKTLLQGETLVSTSISMFLQEVILIYNAGWVIYWYQFLFGFLRLIILGKMYILVKCDFCVGLLLGYLFGNVCIFLMKYSYNNPANLMILTIGACYGTFYLGAGLAQSRIIVAIVSAMMIANERQSLSKEVEESLENLWKTISCIMMGTFLFCIGATAPVILQDYLEFKDYIIVFVTYLLWNISRFFSFFLFSPILSRLGYGMTFQNMIICVWAGLKHPICINLASQYFKTYVISQLDFKARTFFVHTFGVYFLMLLINGTFTLFLFKALGLAEISTSRHINMNNCIKYLYEARSRTVAILKMDRFLSDANWPLVLNSTALKHPYRKLKQNLQSNGEEEDDDYLGYKFTFCPDCEKEIPNEPSPREMRDMTREAKLRILKLKKTIFSRHYKNGLVSKEGLRILHQAVEIAIDSEDLVIELDGLHKLFTKESCFYRCLRNRLQAILKSKNVSYKPPRKWWKMLCYNLVKRKFFPIVMYIVVVIHLIFISAYLKLQPEKFTVIYFLEFTTNVVFSFIYLLEFLLKLFAYSWIDVIQDGFPIYFSSNWNIIEYVIVCISLIVLVIQILQVTVSVIPQFFYFEMALILFLFLRLTKMLQFLSKIPIVKSFPNATLKFLNNKVDSHKALAFELAKNYITAEEEILENLHQIVDNNKIRDLLKEKIENDRLAIARRLGLFEKDGNWLAVTVKTKAAMRSILNSMKDDINELKISGWVDDIEYNKLLKALSERYKYVNNLKAIAPTSPKYLFQEVSYMGDDQKLIDFMYSNVATKKYDPGDIMVDEDNIVEGIYIVVTGVFMVTYTPKESVTSKLRAIGVLPGVDNVCSIDYEQPMCEYIVPGNTIGELSTITERPYSAIIVAETHSQVYIIRRDIVKKAIEMDMDPVTGLACRIWKFIAFRKAISVMINVPSYRSYTQEKLKYIVERSFVPDLSNYKVFVVNEMMQDVILIEGVVVDFNTRDLYTGPCYIPRAVQRLVLPKSSFVSVEVPVETKLLVIPAKDFDEYEIMMNEEDTCELVNDDDSKRIRHFIQVQGSFGAKISKHTRSMLGYSTSSRKRMGAAISTATTSVKSKISFLK